MCPSFGAVVAWPEAVLAVQIIDLRWRAAMNLRIAGRKQPWKSRHFDQTRFDFPIVALAGVFIAGKVMQTKGLPKRKPPESLA